VSAFISSSVSTPARFYRELPVDEDDAVAILAKLKGGLVASLDASLVSPGRRNRLSWELNGSKGSLAWNLEAPNVLHVYRRGVGRTSGFAEVIVCEADHPLVTPWWPSGHVLGWEHGHVNVLAYFVEVIANNATVQPYGATFLDGLRAAQVTEAVRKAAATFCHVNVAEAPWPVPIDKSVRPVTY
jgi:predicted dehydrogenase